MMQYVQHLSGQGEKFRVLDNNPFCWHINVSDLVQDCWVPKSEYRLCDPPEKWEDVTARLVEHIDTTFRSRWDDPHEWGCALIMTAGNSPYRLRRVQFLSQHERMWAFVVEKRMP